MIFGYKPKNDLKFVSVKSFGKIIYSVNKERKIEGQTAGFRRL